MTWALGYLILSVAAVGTALGLAAVRELRRHRYTARGLRALERYSRGDSK